MRHFVKEVVDYCISGGIGELYATSGVSIQDGYRRESGAPTIAVFTQSPGTAFAQDQTEEVGIQVLVDSVTVDDARDVAREIYNLLHETVADYATNFGSYHVLWLRGVAPPQDIGPGPGGGKRFVVSTNFIARIKR